MQEKCLLEVSNYGFVEGGTGPSSNGLETEDGHYGRVSDISCLGAIGEGRKRGHSGALWWWERISEIIGSF